MKKIKVGYQLGEWTYAGTARSHFRILEAIDRDHFEPYALVWRQGQNDLLPALEKALGDHVIFYDRSFNRLGPEDAYRPESTNFTEVVAGLDLDILHGARGGYPEWPLSTGRHARLQVETNIFGQVDPSPTLDRSIAICHCIAERRGKADAVIYNPIPTAELEGPSLRADLGIPEDAIVCGRIGRPANFDPIAIEAFARVVREIPNLYYLVVAPCGDIRAWVERDKTPNVIFLPPTADDAWIAKFHRTLDIFLHYRMDGEVMSTAIAQAMMYGIPVISHNSHHFNGQRETVGNGGVVVDHVEHYAEMIAMFASKPEWHKGFSAAGRKRATECFEQSMVIRQIEEKYREWLR